MAAAEIMDVIARLPDCDRQAADAVSAYTQVKLEDAPKLLKIRKCRRMDTSSTTQMAQTMEKSEDPTVLPERSSYGHPFAGLLWERQFEEALLELGLEKIPKWKCMFRSSETRVPSVSICG